MPLSKHSASPRHPSEYFKVWKYSSLLFFRGSTRDSHSLCRVAPGHALRGPGSFLPLSFLYLGLRDRMTDPEHHSPWMPPFGCAAYVHIHAGCLSSSWRRRQTGPCPGSSYNPVQISAATRARGDSNHWSSKSLSIGV